MYAVCMFSERLQILVSPEQRKRLEAEAKRRGVSVSGLIRSAVDEHLGSVSREERSKAVDAVREMQGRFLSPAALKRLVEEERVEATGEADE